MDPINKLSYGLYVLSTNDGDKVNGCIINTACQVASKPEMISVSVNKSGLTHDMVAASGKFCVSVLSEETPFSVFKHFGFASGRDTQKFFPTEGMEFGWTEDGLPYLKSTANAYIEAAVTQKIDLGSHTLFIGEVIEKQNLSDVNSATYSYYHSHIKPKKKPAASKGWVCKICGYIYEGEELPSDFTCPICKHPASDFEKL